MNLVILVPMLGRPQRVKPLLASIHAATPQARVLFLTTPGDDAVAEQIDAASCERLEVEYAPGDYARKTNRGYQHTTEELIFLGADDLHFHPGWFDACTKRLDPGIGVVGTNDLTNPRTMTGRHSTHSLVTREYADRGLIDRRPGILCEDYPHEYCDDELIGTARKRRAFVHATDAHVEHLHPMGGKAPMDEMYAQQEARLIAGRDIFRRRRRLWT